jgi:outer membrane murein-binding lipoprotein Lpp
MNHQELKDRYAQLCKQRDAVNAKVAPLQAKLDAAHARINAAQADAVKIKAEIDALRGGEDWLALKKEIGVLARAV